jgi:hypothetical protein
MKNWLKKLWAKPKVRAVVERTWRGGLVTVVAAYVGGDLVLSEINVNTINDVVALFCSGAVSSLLLALGISKATGSGPALNEGESIKP